MSHHHGIIVSHNDERTQIVAISILDGNAFSIIAAGRKELKRQGRHEEISAFTAEATSGDYKQVIATMVKWFPEEVIELC